MTTKQRIRLALLWDSACAVQGWNPKDAEFRRNFRLDLLGTDSTSTLNEKQITRLFDELIHRADPLSIDKAAPAAIPALGEDENRRRQLFFVIGEQRFEDAYIARCADGFCNAEGKAEWRKLSIESLEKLSWTLKARARERDAEEGKRDEVFHRVTPYHQRPWVKRARAEKRAHEREQPVIPRPGVLETVECPF